MRVLDFYFMPSVLLKVRLRPGTQRLVRRSVVLESDPRDGSAAAAENSPDDWPEREVRQG